MALNNKNIGYAVADERKLNELTFNELNSLLQICITISNGRHHRDYKKYYASAAEEIRLHIDNRLQNKVFHTSNPKSYFNQKRKANGLEEINISN